MRATGYALVPNADGTALLVDGGRLPTAETESDRTTDVLESLRRSLSLDTPFLRIAARLERAKDDVHLLHAFEAPPLDWRPPAPVSWLSLGDADAGTVTTPEFADAAQRWLDEQRGAPVPRERSPWARPGWLAGATAWVASQADVRGTPELVRQWPLSAVYRFPTPEGPLYLKATFALFTAEPAITEAIGREHPGLAPEVVAVEPRQGWLLMREFGSDLGGDDRSRWPDIYRTASAIQRSWVGRTAELTALGASSRPLDLLRAETDSTEVHAGLRRLESFGLPETLVHGDLHPWNSVVEPHGIRLIDWSDAMVAHPFLDLGAALWEPMEGDEHAAILEAYLEPWAELLPTDELREAARLGEMAGCLLQAISYRAIANALEPSDRWLFAHYDRSWVERAVDLGKALQPG